jgi:hypothetical protein
MPRVAFVVCACVLVACGSAARTPAPTDKPGDRIVVDTDRFPHGLHTSDKPRIRGWQGRGLGCTDCHEAEAVRAGRVARPGTNKHAPCDDCHADEFYKPPGKLCRVCHVSVDPFTKGGSPLQPYPERGATQTLAATFSHRLHLDYGKMESAAGAHVACTDCHDRDATREPILPGHKQCARCHETAAKVKAVLGMATCAGCHPMRDIDLDVRGRIFITADLRFHHANHEKERSGAAVPCQTCHTNVREAASRGEMMVPAMERCAQCHEDSARTPDRVSMRNCNVCHSTIDPEQRPPPSHVLRGSKGNIASTRAPIDHTLHFRTHHAEQAADRDATCRFCHTEISGAKEDSCFQCHERMRPHDHTLMFRDDHGRDAETDGTRCATCHAPETCAACHSLPPRSHNPLGIFKQGGHAEQARFALSACLTCHTYEDTCVKCHRAFR